MTFQFHTNRPATSWAILDKSGDIIASQNAHRHEDPASTTKMATVYTLGWMMQTGQISKDFLRDHSKDVYRMTMRSNNFAAVRLAVAAGGSEANFCRIMTNLMQSRGLHDSHFIKANGMPKPGHYSTAADMARVPFLLERDYPELVHLFSYAQKDGMRNTGHTMLEHGWCEFGKTGTGTKAYGSEGRGAFVAGHEHGYYVILGATDTRKPGIHYLDGGHRERNRFCKAADQYLDQRYGHGKHEEREQHRRAPQAPAASPQGGHAPACTIEIENGDSLVYLARRYGVDLDVLKAVNHLKGDSLPIGSKLVIPGVSEITVRPGQSLAGIAATIAKADGPGGIDTQEVVALIRRINPELRHRTQVHAHEEIVIPRDVRTAADMQQRFARIDRA